jgi:tungstate transport system permease protein
MSELLEASRQAIYLLFSGDPALWSIVTISFSVSLKAIVLTTPLALLLAFTLAYARFFGQRALISTFHTLLALPAVVAGLALYLFLSRSGPLGDLRLLFTQTAMIMGQMILAFPILVAMGHSAIQAADRRAWETATTLGAGPARAMMTVMYEVRFGLMAAVIAGFGRIIAEVGCALMVGGNIEGYTRNITTAIALETSKGEFAQGIALGLVLLLLALALNFSLTWLQGRGVMTA